MKGYCAKSLYFQAKVFLKVCVTYLTYEGVGKTYAAKRLAYSMMGVKNVERVMMVQFHQSYSYEDFIMGFRPSATGFELKKGAFYSFCILMKSLQFRGMSISLV